MRLRKRDLKEYKYFKREKVQESDGTTYDDWVGNGTIQANIKPAGGKIQAEMYGERLVYMMNGLAEFDQVIIEGDAVAVYTTDEPDYKIVSVQCWSHKVFTLEKIKK